MARRVRLLTGLSTIALTGALALSGCGGEGEGEAVDDGAATSVAAGEAEGESASGESEGGESEGEGSASGGDPATDDVEYLYRLGLIRGHLVAFVELSRAGAHDMALTHAKHPASELYADLAPAFEARGLPGFADELTALSDQVEAKGEIDELYATLLAAIKTNEPDVSVAEKLLSVASIAQTAGDEFVLGVDSDGVVINMHEYQDAYGFLTAARTFLSAETTTDINETEAIAVAHEQLDLALGQFSGLIAEETEGQASVLYGAASRIEIAALGLG